MPGLRRGLTITGPDSEKFVLSDVLGRGAFGEVYSAVGQQSGRVLAAKLLPIEGLEDLEARTALLNEAAVGTQIVHPNVVRVVHVERDGPPDIGPYLMMEFVPGGTLKSLLDAQRSAGAPVPLERAIRMMTDIAQGAKAINARLIHRDIKPDNILLDGERLKISDLGISKLIEEQTRSRTFKGGQHIRYMAPEGWEGSKNTYKLDIYSAGLIFGEILTLQHPLTTSVKDLSDWHEWRKAHLFGSLADLRTLRPDVSRDLAQIVIRMTNKRPQERPEWNEVLDRLSGVAAEENNRFPLEPALEAAFRQQQEEERRALALAEKGERAERLAELYRYSREQLVGRLDEVVMEFNSKTQGPKIEIQTGHDQRRLYLLPNRLGIALTFFSRGPETVQLIGGRLTGGAFIGVSHPMGLSGNFLRLQMGEDDLFGEWRFCFTKHHALVADPRQIKAKYDISAEPFGFRREAQFFDEIQWAGRGGMHIFTYEILDSTTGEVMSAMLTNAFKVKSG